MIIRTKPIFLREYAISLSRLDPQDILKKLHVKHYEDNILNMTKAQLAVERLPPDLQKSKFSSMMIKMEMQKIVLEREGDNPQKPALQETAQE